jgi:hypothetical protein
MDHGSNIANSCKCLHRMAQQLESSLSVFFKLGVVGLVLMMRRIRFAVVAIALIALIASFVTATSQAGTIVKLNLGGVGPDVGMGAPAGLPAGVLGTVDQTCGPSPAGDQLTDIEFTGFLNYLPDVNTNTATFSLNGLNAVGPANVFGTLVIQNFNGGIFSLYDSADNLLLQGPMGNSVLTGIQGPPGTGALFTSTFTNITGGSLQPFIVPGTASLSMNLTTVNGGNGFSVGGVGPQLNAFLADAVVSISADPVPEPSTFVLLSLACASVFIRRR